MANFRSIEVLRGGQFTVVPFESLKKGDRFRAFESDGKPVDNGAVFTAASDAESYPDGNAGVRISGMEG